MIKCVKCRFNVLATAVFALSLLAGCDKKPADPLNYLPQGDIYLGVNMERLKDSKVGERLAGEMGKGSSSEQIITERSRSSKSTIDIGGVGNYSFYSIVTGDGPTFSEDVMKMLGQEGTRAELNGLDTVTTDSGVAAILNDQTLLMCRTKANLETMTRASDAKTGRARDAKAFQLLEDRLSTSSIILSAAVQPLLARLESSMPAVQQNLDPMMREAIGEIDTIVLSADATDKANVQVFLSLPSQDAADKWKGRLTMMLTAARMAQMAPPQLELINRAAMADMQASPSGLTITLNFTDAEIEQFIAAAEKMVAQRAQLRR